MNIKHTIEPQYDWFYSFQLYIEISCRMELKYQKTVILVSTLIMLYQAIANADLGVLSQFTHQKGNNWAGPLSTSLLFVGSGIGSLYNKYIGRYPYRYTIFIGSLGYTLFISLGLIFMKLGFSTGVEIGIFFGSFISGLIISIFYNSQFNYINVLSKIDNQEIKYFGINMGMVQCSNLIGNFASSLLIEPLGQFMYVLVMDLIILPLSFLFLFVVKEPDERFEDHCLEQELDSKVEGNDNSTAIEQFNRLTSAKCKKIEASMSAYVPIFCYVFTGVIIAFVYSALSIVIYRTFEHKMSEISLNRLTFIIFIFEGVGELIGGMGMIFLSHRIVSTARAYMGVCALFLLSILIIYLGSKFENEYIIALGSVLTGIADCSSMILALSIAGIWKQSGITAYNIGQCAGVAASAMFMVFVNFEAIILWIEIFLIVCVLSLWRYEIRLEQLDK